MVKLFSPPYGDGTTTPKYPVMDDAFPSPCGDKLKFMTQLKILNYAQAFPSPCGDKLKSVTTSAFVGLICFRPLMEDNFTIPHIEPKEKNHPQEKHGWSRKDKP